MRVLGIDLGATSVKAVEFESGFGRFEIRENHEQKVPTGGSAAEVAGAMLASLPRKPDRIIIALRTSRTTFRNMDLPARDRRAIQAAVGFELEDELPFEMDNALYDYSVLGSSGQISHVHVGATLKKHVESLLNELNTHGVDPDFITTEPWAYRALFNRILPANEKDQPILFVQSGSEHTTIYVHFKGKPIIAREVAIGGRDLTAAVAQMYAISPDQAEEAKLGNGFVLPPSQRENHTPDQQRFSDTLLLPLQDLLREIRQSSLTCKNITHQPLGMVYISGGTSQLPGLDRLIEEELNTPVKHLLSLSALSSATVTYSEQTDKAMVLAASLALCLSASDRVNQLNLRQGDFAKRTRSREINVQALRKPLLAIALILTCLAASLITQTMVYNKRIAEADKALDKVLPSFFPNKLPKELKVLVKDSKKLTSEIEKTLLRQRKVVELMAPDPENPMNYLRELSSSIPADLKVDMIRFQAGASAESSTKALQEIKDRNASLSFGAADQKMMDRLKAILEKKLTAVTQGANEEAPTPDGKGKQIKITFSGKLGEASSAR